MNFLLVSRPKFPIAIVAKSPLPLSLHLSPCEPTNRWTNPLPCFSWLWKGVRPRRGSYCSAYPLQLLFLPASEANRSINTFWLKHFDLGCYLILEPSNETPNQRPLWPPNYLICQTLKLGLIFSYHARLADTRDSFVEVLIIGRSKTHTNSLLQHFPCRVLL